MERTQRESRKQLVSPERRYMRLQVVGMSFGLSILPAIILACMFNLGAFVGQIATLLFVVGCAFFFFGLVGRQELKEQKGRETNGDDEQN